MDQPELFGNTPLDASNGDEANTQVVKFAAEFSQWQGHARAMLRAERTPDSIWWQPQPPKPNASSQDPATQSSTRTSAKGTQPTHQVPRRFLSLARQASYHSNADRWALLYSLLWRLTHREPHLLELACDPQVVRMNKYVNAVNRDIHKMKAFVRFREIDVQEIDEQHARQQKRYVAWFEPEHFVVEPASRFFRDRFSNMAWSILTPQRCVHWEGQGKLWYTDGVTKGAAPPDDAFEEAWRTYYASIFNPARIKLDAMRSEMPQKYWKNLPEAHLIGKLIQDAPARVAEMHEFSKPRDELNCGPTPAPPARELIARQSDKTSSELQRASAASLSCQRCALWRPATQTVFGRGPEDADLMLLGEQPGDTEDLKGEPFVGPAGELLNRALADAGLNREALYLTNVVKHFKFQITDSKRRGYGGKVRLHKSPSVRETEACRAWLDKELEIVQPSVVVCLGATAIRSQLGDTISVLRDRGQLFETEERIYIPTLHPSFVLRQREQTQKQRYYRQLVCDLERAAAVSLELRSAHRQ